MTYKYRVNIGVRSSPGFPWERAEREQFVANVLSAGDMIEWIKGTIIIHTSNPDDILDNLLEHSYSITEDSVLRWINVGAATVAA